MPDSEGYLDKSDNAAGVQGQWYSYAGLDSTINPVPLSPFTLDENNRICTNGTTAPVVGGGFSEYYGAGIGFYLCYSDDNDEPPEFPYTLSECPNAKNMHTKIAGISFHFETTVKDETVDAQELVRVVFREWHREESPYAQVTAPGDYHALFRDAGFGYKEGLPSRPAEIHSILFQVAGSEDGKRNFDFCISDLKLLINPEEEADTSTYEETDTTTMDAGTDCTPANYRDAGLDWIQVGDTDDTNSFEILRTEVTADQYKHCKNAGCCSATGNWEICSVDNMQGDTERDTEPANCVNWFQALAFCKWASGNLPTETQWTRAASGGRDDAVYPWGDDAPTCKKAVMNDPSGNCSYTQGRPTDVCSAPLGNTESGICDMAGNVWEWMEDWYPKTDTIPEETFRMLKGGSYYSKTNALKIESKSMEHPSVPRDIGRIGFRCVK
jgi:hypothetical protein